MKTLDEYTIYCTEEQTKKFIELGAPIIKRWCYEDSFIPFPHIAEFVINDDYYAGLRRFRGYATIPTAEQMINWLETQQGITEIFITIDLQDWIYAIIGKESVINGYEHFSSRKEATLAAIDAVLEYLIKNRK